MGRKSEHEIGGTGPEAELRKYPSPPEPGRTEPSAPPGDDTPKTAFLEFGSTSIKWYAVALSGPAAGEIVEEIKIPWALGYDVFQHRRIGPGTVSKCIATLRELQAKHPRIPLESVTAIGTAALREAQNVEVFRRVLWDELRIRIHIIEGGIEAFLLEMGFRDAVSSYPTGLFDLGGGSLELVEYLSEHSTKKTSIPIGAVRLHCQLRHTRDLFAYVAEGRRNVLATIREHLGPEPPRYRDLIGTGGTVRAVAAIVGEDNFGPDDLRAVLDGEIRGPLEGSLDPHRRKLLLPGILALEGLVAALGTEVVKHRRASVNRGLLTLMSLVPRAGAARA